MELSKLNAGGKAVKRAQAQRPPEDRLGGRESVRLLDRDVAVRRPQDAGQIAGEAAIDGAQGQSLRPHGVIGEAVRTHDRGSGEFMAEFA